MQGSSSQKYSQMSKKIEVKATKKKGRMLVAKEQIEPGKHLFYEVSNPHWVPSLYEVGFCLLQNLHFENLHIF